VPGWARRTAWSPPSSSSFTVALVVDGRSRLDGGLTLARQGSGHRRGPKPPHVPARRPSTSPPIGPPARSPSMSPKPPPMPRTTSPRPGHSGTVTVNGNQVTVTVSITQPMQILSIGGIDHLTVHRDGHGHRPNRNGGPVMDPCRAHPQRRRLLSVLLAGIGRPGIPWALWHFIGLAPPAPCPFTGPARPTPSISEASPTRPLIDALAAVVWLTWAVLRRLHRPVEVPRRPRRAPRPPAPARRDLPTGPPAGSSPLSSSPPSPSHLRTTQVTALGSLGGGLSTLSGRQQVATLVLHRCHPAALGHVQTGHKQTSARPRPRQLPTKLVAHIRRPARRPLSGHPPSDSWAIRWIGRRSTSSTEGRAQPDGRALTDPHWIYPGWTLVLPARRARACGADTVPEDTSVTRPGTKACRRATTAPTRGNGTGGAGSAYASAQWSAPARPHSTTSTEARPKTPSSSAPGANLRVEEVRGCRDVRPKPRQLPRAAPIAPP